MAEDLNSLGLIIQGCNRVVKLQLASLRAHGHGRRPGIDPKFVIDAGQVGFDGPFADAQMVGDFLVSLPLGNCFENLHLPVCQVDGTHLRCGCRTRGIGVSKQTFDDLRLEQGFAGRRGPDRV